MANQYREGEKLVMLKVLAGKKRRRRDARRLPAVRQMLAAIQGMAQRFPELINRQFKECCPPSIGPRPTSRTDVCVATAPSRTTTATAALRLTRSTRMLGFRPAPLPGTGAVGIGDSMMERPMLADDGDQVKELLGWRDEDARRHENTGVARQAAGRKGGDASARPEMAARASAARAYYTP